MDEYDDLRPQFNSWREEVDPDRDYTPPGGRAGDRVTSAGEITAFQLFLSLILRIAYLFSLPLLDLPQQERFRRHCSHFLPPPITPVFATTI